MHNIAHAFHGYNSVFILIFFRFKALAYKTLDKSLGDITLRARCAAHFFRAVHQGAQLLSAVIESRNGL